jgi:hypothetical protein
LTYRLGRYDHITDALVTVHSLQVSERVDYKLAIQSYRILHGAAPNYLNDLRRTAALDSRQYLRSSAPGRLEVPAYKLNTVGRRSFAVAAPLFWNTATGRTNCADAACLPSYAQDFPFLEVFSARFLIYVFYSPALLTL